MSLREEIIKYSKDPNYILTGFSVDISYNVKDIIQRYKLSVKDIIEKWDKEKLDDLLSEDINRVNLKLFSEFLSIVNQISKKKIFYELKLNEYFIENI